MLQLLLFALGVALIVKGSDYFVDASVTIGERFRLPRVVVGGTLVSVATTTPELTVSIFAGTSDVPGLAIGNALGSVAVNIGLIMALAAIIMRSFEMSPGEFRWRSQAMLGVAALLFLMTLDLRLPQWRGLLLIGMGMAYLLVDYRRGRKRYATRVVEATEHLGLRFKSARMTAIYFLLGAAMVISGSRLLVTTGASIAAAIGVPNVIIGLTMVALGTSLPELATTMASVRKRVFDLAAGNLIGANALNLTLVIGTAASISPLQLARSNQLYVFPAVLVMLTVFFFLVRSKNRLTRGQGFVMLGLYVAFVAGLAVLNL
ncbi:MAG: calcium/sodium antiporter [Chloroflexi bacterium]|nr:calcium/sodium antiporter [Chloroflexota bacterium]